MLNLYCYKRIEHINDSRLLTLFLSDNEYEGGLFQQTRVAPFKQMVTFVESAADADYILMPHDYIAVVDKKEYLKELVDFSKQVHKKIIVFAYADLSDPIEIENAIILRPTAYKSKITQNEIIVPAFIDDLGSEAQSVSRQKGEIPKVGFVGMVTLPDIFAECKFRVRLRYKKILALLNKATVYEFQGLYYRRRAIEFLKKATSVETNFIIRNSYSASNATISLDPKQAREEYLSVIENTDLGLCVRGNGNYSLRFYELLASGRIPLFVDTDMILPNEESIDYDSFMLRIDAKELHTMDEQIKSFWNTLTDEQYVEMQKKAKEIFDTRLRVDMFYEELFKTLKAKV